MDLGVSIEGCLPQPNTNLSEYTRNASFVFIYYHLGGNTTQKIAKYLKFIAIIIAEKAQILYSKSLQIQHIPNFHLFEVFIIIIFYRLI